MKKITFSILLLVFFLIVNGLTLAEDNNYQLIGTIIDCTCYFDVQSLKIVHDSTLDQDCIDVWIKVVSHSDEWKKDHIAIIKRIGIWKKGYNDFSYRLIHMQYSYDGQQKHLMFMDYSSDDKKLNTYSLSPMQWDKITRKVDKGIYDAIMKYVEENKEEV